MLFTKIPHVLIKPPLLVHSMMNINLPTIDSYHTQNISILATLLLGPIFEVMERVVEFGIQILNIKASQDFLEVITLRKSTIPVISVSRNVHPLESCLVASSLSFQTP